MRIFIRNTHLILALGLSAIIIEGEEVSLGVVALVRHGLVVHFVLQTTRIAGRFQVSSVIGLLIPASAVLVEAHREVALSLVDRARRVVLILLLIVVVLVVILIIVLRLRDRLAVILLVENGPVRLYVLRGNHRKSTDWTVLRTRLETLAGHVEVLQLQLLYAGLQHSVSLPQLDQLRVHRIYSELTAFAIRQLTVHVELPILRVRLSQYPLHLV